MIINLATNKQEEQDRLFYLAMDRLEDLIDDSGDSRNYQSQFHDLLATLYLAGEDGVTVGDIAPIFNGDRQEAIKHLYLLVKHGVYTQKNGETFILTGLDGMTGELGSGFEVVESQPKQEALF